MKFYDSILRVLVPFFESGWLFFLPYVFLYWIFWILPLPTAWLERVFAFLHGVIGFGCVACFWIKRKEKAVYYWAVVFFILLVPGAYLEYPSDPWEHFRRILSWSTTEYIRQNYVSTKFVYFWQWTLIRFLEIPYRRMALTVFSAFWQTLLCYQVYRMALSLQFEKKWAYLQSFAFFCLFGTNLFGIRYYALSSTPLSMIGLFAAVQLLVGSGMETRKRIGMGALCLTIMLSNHPQSLLHLLFLMTSLYLFHLYQKMNADVLKRSLFILGIIWAISLFFGYCIRRYYPGLFQAFESSELSRWGTIKPWLAHSRYMETFGVHGILALFFAVVFFKSMPLLSLFVLLPIAVLVFPPGILALGAFVSGDTPYRVLYAFPFSIALVQGLRRFFSQFEFTRARTLPIVFLVIVGLALPYSYPWRGRLLFQISPTPPGRDYVEIDRLAIWMKANRNYPMSCRFLIDDLSGYILFTHLGREIQGLGRLKPSRIQKRVESSEDLVWAVLGYKDEPDPFCGIIVRTEKSLNEKREPSWIALSSRHWPDSSGDIRYVAEDFEKVFQAYANPIWGLIFSQLRVLFSSMKEDPFSKKLPGGYIKIPINEDYYLIESTNDATNHRWGW